MDPAYHGAGYMDPEFRRHLNGYGQNEYPHPHPHTHPQDIHEAVQREIEKERIRKEIIMSEIVRRRALVEEVRRELMMEREMALQQTSDGFPFGSSPVTGLELPMSPSLLVAKPEGWSAEERLGMLLEDKEKLKWSENGGLKTLSFHMVAAGLRISEVKPASEANKNLLLTKPDVKVSGSKMKDVTPPEVVDIKLLDDVIANKISKEEWSCALCRVMASSKKSLNEHMFGQKHKAKVAALRVQRTGKNYSIGLFPKKATKSILAGEKGVKLKAQSLFSHKVGKATPKKVDLSLLEYPKSEEKTQAEIRKMLKNEDDPRKKVQKNENDPRKKGCKLSKVMNPHKVGNIELPADVNADKKFEGWTCALCQVIATSKKDLNEHVLGKKHKLKVAALIAQRTGEYRSIELSPKKATKSSHVEEEVVKPIAQFLLSQKAGKATSNKDDSSLLENPKSEHLKKTQAEVVRKVQKNEDDPRKKVQKNKNLRNNGCKVSEVMHVRKSGNIELPSDIDANKKSKDWRCTLCQVVATTEKDLNEHVLGKKQKLTVAALRAQRTGEYRSTKSSHVEEEGVKLIAQSLFSPKAGQATSKKDDLSLLNPKSEHLKKNQAEVNLKTQKHEDDPRKKVQKNESDPTNNGCKVSEVMHVQKSGNIELPSDINANKKSKEWRCALCQVVATSEKDLNEHALGKKHKSKEAALRS